MTDCPYCHSLNIRYSPTMSLHLVRAVMGSEKRYCADCEKKWRIRPRRHKTNTSFYAVAIPLAIVFSLGMFRLTDQRPQISMNADGTINETASAGRQSFFQKMVSGSSTSFFMNGKNSFSHKGKKLQGASAEELSMMSGLTDAQRKMAELALRRMSKDEIIAKLKKLESNPKALAKLPGPHREMAEQAIKIMKTQKR